MSYSRIGTALYGLGWDSPVGAATSDGTYTAHASRVVHLPPSAASHVPSVVGDALRRQGYAGSAQWVTGGLRITYRAESDWAKAASAAGRRAAVLTALAQAAEVLGPNVYFEVDGHGPHPASRASGTGSGSGTESGGAATSVRTLLLQQTLAQRGFDPGPTDGRWGGRTSSALALAAGRAGQGAHGVVAANGATQVTMRQSLWDAVQRLPALTVIGQREGGGAALPGGGGSTSDEPGGSATSSDDATVPVILTAGAGVLVLVGAFFLWKGSRRRVALAANRRRRRRWRS
jgi:hypothetical protein